MISRLQSARTKIIQHHSRNLQEIRDSLMECDKKFQDSFFKAERELNEAEVRYLHNRQY